MGYPFLPGLLLLPLGLPCVQRGSACWLTSLLVPMIQEAGAGGPRSGCTRPWLCLLGDCRRHGHQQLAVFFYYYIFDFETIVPSHVVVRNTSEPSVFLYLASPVVVSGGARAQGHTRDAHGDAVSRRLFLSPRPSLAVLYAHTQLPATLSSGDHWPVLLSNGIARM